MAGSAERSLGAKLAVALASGLGFTVLGLIGLTAPKGFGRWGCMA